MSVAVRRLASEIKAVRRMALCIFLAAFAAFAAVSPQDPGNFQVITRLAVPLSFVETHQLNIDRYAEWTSDKAEWNGHFYADKPPGHPILALPAVVAVRTVLSLLGRPVDGTSRPTLAIYAFWATIGVNGLLSALAASALFVTAIRLGASLTGAVFGSTALALGTPFFGWSSAFFAHSVSASLLILAFAVAVRVLTDEEGTDGKDAAYWSLQLGTLLGYAAVVELTAAPLSALAGLIFVVLVFRARGSRRALLAGAAILGGILGFLPLPLYNYFAFGDPLHLGYSSVVGFEGMQEGFFGLTMPNLWVVTELLLGSFRGLLPLSPVLILVPVGYVAMLRRGGARLAAILSLLVIAYYLAINSSYFYWEGGWSMGPRHIVAALPFLGLALCFAWPQRRTLQLSVLLLLVVSLEFSLIAAAGGMFPPEKFKVPLYEFALERLMSPRGEMWRIPLVVLAWLVFGWIGSWAARGDAARSHAM